MTVQFRSHLGLWRVASTHPREQGDRVSVTRRNGTASEVIIGALVAHDPDRDLPYLYAFEDARRAAAASPAPQNRLAVISRGGDLIRLMERAQRRPLAQDGTPGNVAHVRFHLNNTARGLRLEMAGASSRYAGQLLALSQERGRAGRRQLYGRLVADAATEPVYHATVGQSQIEQDIHNEVVSVLRAFANDPAGYSGAHGRATGHCCYCGRGLTDPRSVAVGYGPICADYYGLPWGDAPPPPFDVTQGPTSQRERMIDNAREQPSNDDLDAADDATNEDDFAFDVASGALDPRDHQDRLEHVQREAAQNYAAAVDRIADAEREIEGVPTLEDIQNEPSALRRMAMAAQRASAGLPNVQRNARGELLNATNAGIETATGEQLDAWGRQYNVLRHVRSEDGLHLMRVRSDDELRRAILGRALLTATQARERALVASSAAGVVTQTYRRTRPAAPGPMPPAAPGPMPPSAFATAVERVAARRAARAERTQQRPTFADETTTTVHRAERQRPTPEPAMREEDDFVWPPRSST